MEQDVQFRFIEFNKRRQLRGVEAARVEVVIPGEDPHWLWMSRGDIMGNIREFGDCPELRKALDAIAKGE